MTIDINRDSYRKILAALAEYGSDKPKPAQKDIANLIKDLFAQGEGQDL